MSRSYVSATMLHSASGPQITADGAVGVKQDASPDVNSEHNVLGSSAQLDRTRALTGSLTRTAASEGGMGGLGGGGGSEREDGASPPPPPPPQR